MLIGELYRQVRGRFRNAGLSTPELDARVLVSAALKNPGRRSHIAGNG
ncbi:hypothetical protein QW131_21100 [Roseibium salinum]|nr:hypothetical protein [Roseibium salinum]